MFWSVEMCVWPLLGWTRGRFTTWKCRPKAGIKIYAKRLSIFLDGWKLGVVAWRVTWRNVSLALLIPSYVSRAIEIIVIFIIFSPTEIDRVHSGWKASCRLPIISLFWGEGVWGGNRPWIATAHDPPPNSVTKDGRARILLEVSRRSESC